MKVIMLCLQSCRKDGKFIDTNTNEEFDEEEAIQVVKDIWRDTGGDIYSWDLEKVYFKYGEES